MLPAAAGGPQAPLGGPGWFCGYYGTLGEAPARFYSATTQYRLIFEATTYISDPQRHTRTSVPDLADY